MERGVAFLVGHVMSAAQVETALVAARRVPGLKDVVSQIQIITGEPLDPVDLVNRVSFALDRDLDLLTRPIHVAADPDETITLTAEVETTEQRARAERVARRVTGGHHVHNRLRSPET